MNTYRGINGAILNDIREKTRVSPFQYSSIQAAVNAAPAYGVVEIPAGAYDESVTISKPITLIGSGARGSVYIEPSAEGASGMLVLADDVTLINIGVAGEGTADYALQVGDADVSPARFRAYGCKFEGPDAAAVILKGAGDVLLQDCEFAWCGSGLLFAPNEEGFCTQIFIERCRFHNNADVCIGLDDTGGVVNLQVIDCIFENGEDGTPPAHYIKVDRAGDTGMISGCRFATATHDAEVIAVADGIMYAANITEEGVSTARPTSET